MESEQVSSLLRRQFIGSIPSVVLGRWVFGFELVPVRIQNERRVVVCSIMRPEAGSTLICAAEFQCCRVETIDGLAARRNEGQMESPAGRRDRLGLEDE